MTWKVPKPNPIQDVGDHDPESVRQYPDLMTGGARPVDKFHEALTDPGFCAHKLTNLVRRGTYHCELRLHGLLNTHPTRDYIRRDAIPDGPVAEPVDDEVQR